MHTIKVMGSHLESFLDFVEKETAKSKQQARETQKPDPYEELKYDEVTVETDGSRAFTDLIALLLTGTIQVITTLVIEYYKNKINQSHELTFTIVKNGRTVTLKGLSEEEIKNKLKELSPEPD